MLKRFNYFGTEAPAWLLINKVNRPFFTAIETETITIPGRPGVAVLARTTKEKPISIDVTIMATSDNDLMYKAEWLAAWLDSTDAAPLIFNDEPDRYYMATFAPGDGVMENIAATGKGTITFLIADPYKYGLHVNKDLGSGATIKTIANKGTAPIQPLYTVRFSQASSFFALVGPDGFIQFGSAAEAGTPPVQKEQTILRDPMNDLAPWTASGINVDFGKASGTFFVENGTHFIVNDFEDAEENANDWHGPILRRSLPSQVNDFRFSAEIQVFSEPARSGRVEVWLLSASGVIQARFILWDRYKASELNSAHITAGPNGNAISLIDSEGNVPKGFNSFRGRFTLNRQGTEWRASVTKMNKYNREDPKTTVYKFKDIPNNFKEPIAQIQIGIRKFGAMPAANMQIRDLHMQRINQVTNKAAAPVLFNAGDVLEIDTRSGNAWRNGEYMNGYMDPGSSFFKITPGTTEIQALADNPAAVTLSVDYDERHK